jgi:hypothetical protein
MIALLCRSVAVLLIGVVGLVCGERRWRSVDRARSCLRTGRYHELAE